MMHLVTCILFKKQILPCSIVISDLTSFVWCQFANKVTVNNANNQNTTGFLKIVIGKTIFFFAFNNALDITVAWEMKDFVKFVSQRHCTLQHNLLCYVCTYTFLTLAKFSLHYFTKID